MGNWFSSESDDIVGALENARKSGHKKDANTKHEFVYQSKIECPIVELRKAHKDYMEAMMSTKSYAIYNQAAHDRESAAVEVINQHPRCLEYWKWFNDHKTNIRIKREMFPEDYAHLPKDF